MTNNELLKELLKVLMSSVPSMRTAGVLVSLALSGMFDWVDASIQFISQFLCHLVDWYL